MVETTCDKYWDGDVELAKLCINDNYFQFNEQTFDTSKGNALPAFLANIFMAELEKKNCQSWRFFLVFGLDTLMTYFVERLLIIMNRRHNTIKFTYEIEQENVLFLLDAEIRRSDTNLDFNVYRKSTAAKRYITIDSQYCIQHKSAAFNSMVNHLFTILLKRSN
jgi:hypothetical protein